MNVLLSYFWPALLAGLVVGIIAGRFVFRVPRRRLPALAIGIVASILLAILWHGPLGAADRFRTNVEKNIRETMAYYEIPQVNGILHDDPLTRRVLLKGPADDFQKSELVRLIDGLHGVSNASWSSNSGGVPLIVEGSLVALLGFLIGLVVAYLVELRRRYNAQWNW